MLDDSRKGVSGLVFHSLELLGTCSYPEVERDRNVYLFSLNNKSPESDIRAKAERTEKQKSQSPETSYLCTISDQIGEILSLRILRLKWGDHVAMNPQTEWGQDPISIYLIFLSPPPM